MAIVNYVQGNIHTTLKFPDGMSKGDMEAAIQKLPFYRPPVPKVPGQATTSLENAKVQSGMSNLPAQMSEEVARIVNMEHPDAPYFSTLVKNIIPNLKEDVMGLINLPVAGYHFGKDIYEDADNFLKGGYYNKDQKWHVSAIEDIYHTLHTGLRAFLGEPIKEGDYTNPGAAWGAFAKQQGVGSTLALWVRNHPLDALFMLTGGIQAGGKAVGMTAEKLASTGGTIGEMAGKVDKVLKKTRSPLVYDLSSVRGTHEKPLTVLEDKTHTDLADLALGNPEEALKTAPRTINPVVVRNIARKRIANMYKKTDRVKAARNLNKFLEGLPKTSEEIAALEATPKGMADLECYSYVKGLSEIDPGFYGSGEAGAEAGRKMADADNFVDRSYYALKGGGYLPEPELGSIKYKTRIPYDELYDYKRDVDNLIVAAKEEALEKGTSPVTIYERMIKDRGYKGYIVNDLVRGDVAALFHKLPVEEVVPTGKPITMPRAKWGKNKKGLRIPREYSSNFLVHMVQAGVIDPLLTKYPQVYKAFAAHGAKKVLNRMRLAADNANFQERNMLHNEFFEKFDKLTDEEKDVAVPYLEGRAGFIREPSQEFKDFETWYRNKVEDVTSDLLDRGKLDPHKINETIYGPIMEATGMNMDQVKAELGDFTPVYIHHMFPDVHTPKTSVHFAETTGKAYIPGFFKKRHNVEGYSTDLSTIIPDWVSSYVKFKNTQKFLDNFLEKFGTGVNVKDVKEVEGGLQVKDLFFKDHKIVAPEGILNFYRTKLTLSKEILEAMKNMSFDEAAVESLQKLDKSVLTVSKNRKVWLVPSEIADKMDSYATPFMGSKTAENYAKILIDKPTQLWKDTVLAFSPRWITNNVIGDFFLNTISGIGPLSYTRAFKQKYIDCIPDEISGLSFTRLEKYNPKLGNALKESLIKMAAQAWEKIPGLDTTSKAYNKARDIGFGVNEIFEHPFVRAFYINKARKVAKRLCKEDGIAADEVNIMNKLRVIRNDKALFEPLMNQVKGNLPVFNITTPWERKHLRRLIPFYNWYKFMGLYGAKLPVDHPFITAGMGGVGHLTEYEREKVFKRYFPWMSRIIDENGIPDRYRYLWPINIDKDGQASFFSLKAANPLETLTDMLELKASNLSPLITTPVAYLKGTSSYTEQPFTSPKAQLYSRAKGEEYKEFGEVRPPFLELVMRNLPQYTFLEKMLVPAKQYDDGNIFNPEPMVDPITGEYKYPIDKVQAMIGMLGIKTETLDIDKSWNGYVRKLRIAQRNDFNSKNISLEDFRAILKYIQQDKMLYNHIKQEIEHQGEVKYREQEHELEVIESGR